MRARLLSRVLGAGVFLFLSAPLLCGAELRTEVLSWLPRESGEVAFVELKELRASPHYDLLKQRLVPSHFREFEQFLTSAGIQLERDLEWVAWALVPPTDTRPGELFLGIAGGRFTPDQVKQFYTERELPFDTQYGQTLFPFGDSEGADSFCFAFLDPSTAVFGTRPSLELLLQTRFGSHSSVLRNPRLWAQISELNGRSPVWVALNSHYTQLAVRQLLPEAGKFEEFERMARRLGSSQLHLKLEKELEVRFQVTCVAPEDAQVFSLLLETALQLQRWRLKQAQSPLTPLWEKVQVLTLGDRVEARLAVEDKLVRTLLEHPRPLF